MNLSMFVACEKLILDTTGHSSLITIMSAVDVAFAQGQTAMAQMVAPRDWALVSMWRVPPELINCDMLQKFQVLRPDGTEFANAAVKFHPANGPTAINFINLQGMPIGQAGEVKAVTWVEMMDGTKVTAAYEYYLLIRHLPNQPTRSEA